MQMMLRNNSIAAATPSAPELSQLASQAAVSIMQLSIKTVGAHFLSLTAQGYAILRDAFTPPHQLIAT
jgi:hypothetical protein